MGRQYIFLCDWGEGVNGSRYALIKCEEKDIHLNLDKFGDATDVKYCRVDTGDEFLYVELTGVSEEQDTYAAHLNFESRFPKVPKWKRIDYATFEKR
tara:strand:+ start:2213 stop:2503 length:291 start_codon:yes stop_codon:yes gene_type:complete